MTTILLVEDVPVVRRALTRALNKGGHKVRAACNGTEGLEQVEIGGIDLLLTDVVMPGPIQGDELAHRARSISPDLPVVLISGFTRTADRLEAIREEGMRVLRKPIGRDDLLAVINELIA